LTTVAITSLSSQHNSFTASDSQCITQRVHKASQAYHLIKDCSPAADAAVDILTESNHLDRFSSMKSLAILKSYFTVALLFICMQKLAFINCFVCNILHVSYQVANTTTINHFVNLY
jgi:hypothetical protein